MDASPRTTATAQRKLRYHTSVEQKFKPSEKGVGQLNGLTVAIERVWTSSYSTEATIRFSRHIPKCMDLFFFFETLYGCEKKKRSSLQT